MASDGSSIDPTPSRRGLAITPYVLAFVCGILVMVLEIVAGRLVAPKVGGSLIVWSSVIGVIMGGIGLGNVLGGRLADRLVPADTVGPLFALGSSLVLNCLWVNSAIGALPGLDALPWNLRALAVVILDFLTPAAAFGMLGPILSKMAVSRARSAGRAVGEISLWSSAGSIAGTFLAGFVLIYVFRLSTIVTAVAAALAILATMTGRNRSVVVHGALAAGMLAYSMTPGAISFVKLLCQAAGLSLGVTGLLAIRRMSLETPSSEQGSAHVFNPTLGRTAVDLSFLSFITGATFMALEILAGRLVTRHLGSSLYGWSSVLGVTLGGLCLGGYIGGILAGFVREARQLRWFLRAASVFLLWVLMMETVPKPLADALTKEGKSFLSEAITMNTLNLPGAAIPMDWPSRVLFVVFCVFFLPSTVMGTIGPIITKLAIDRVRGTGLEGRAIGNVSAWGMIGSVSGALLTGLLIIDITGTKGMVVVLSCLFGLAATAVGSARDALWSGFLLAVCLVAFLPFPGFVKRGSNWGIRDEGFDPNTKEDAIAWIDESPYSYIKVDNESVGSGKTTPIGDDEPGKASEPMSQKRTLVLDNLIHGYFILGHPEQLDYDYQHIYALVTHRLVNKMTGAGAGRRGLRALFLGAGCYTFPRYLLHKYPDCEIDVVEIDPAVTRANLAATNLSADTKIRTIIGDARQFVEQAEGRPQYDVIVGDAFNDFTVPWHLTTREFNDKLAQLLSPDGVYLINIIDVYESDAEALNKARKSIEKDGVTDLVKQAEIRLKAQASARRYGGFLGAWTRTAELTFPNVYLFGTDEPGNGLRETFVVVAAKQPLDVIDMGKRADDPAFYHKEHRTEPKPYSDADHKTVVENRSRQIVLTDDYAPVENLLLPVAATRGEDQ